VAFLPVKLVEENPGGLSSYEVGERNPSGFSSYENCGRKPRKREGWRKLGIRVQIPAGAY